MVKISKIRSKDNLNHNNMVMISLVTTLPQFYYLFCLLHNKTLSEITF
jgi:hypothetical protein